MTYESRNQSLLPRHHYIRRFAGHLAIAVAIVILSLLIGIAGYGYFEKLPWIDGFLNSAMLLGGMGPVDPPHTEGGKLFAGCYALYAGLVFLIAAGLLLAAPMHRVLHKFHLEKSGHEDQR